MGGVEEAGRRTPELAKTSRPRPTKVFPRRRLFKQLERAGRRPVTWIAGPPGAGKTTLVSSYLDEFPHCAIWYQLDSGDGDVATFFHYLSLALPGNTQPDSLPRLAPERRANLEIFTRRYFEHLYTQLATPFTVVFDNYHTIPEKSELHRVFRWGLEQMPEGGRAIIISRGNPPNSLGRLELSRALAFLDRQDLRLRLDEARGIARLWRKWDAARHLVPTLHRHTEGWTAGLVLMLEHGAREEAILPEIAAGSRDNRFRYFGGEILDQTDPDTRDVLLKTALLPSITRQAARRLTGNDQADRIIAGMHRRNYFTECLAHEEPVYRYHPLFREFLLDAANQCLSPDELTGLRQCAVQLLEAAGRLEEAAQLYREFHDWPGLTRTCRALAPQLLAQGRTDTLNEWLLAIPEAERTTEPWISYWLGQVQLPVDPNRAAVFFERAYSGFCHNNDIPGRLSAWCGVVNAIVYSWDDFSRLDKWIERLERFESEDGRYPDPSIETRAAVSMFGALMFRRPDHPDIHGWAERGLSLARRINDPAELIRAVELQSHFFAWTGNLARAGALLEEINQCLDSERVPVIVLLGNRMQEAVYLWHTAAFDAAIRAVEDGLALGRSQGVHLMDCRLAAQGVYASIGTGNLTAAEHYLQTMTKALGKGRHLDVAHNHHLRGSVAWLRGDTDTALHETRRANELAEEMGTPFPVALGSLNLARALHARGYRDEAARWLAITRQTADAMQSRMLQHQIAMLCADFALSDGDYTRCTASLATGLKIGRQNSYWMTPSWDAAMAARLCAVALEHGIEEEYVQELIRKRGLVSAEDSLPGPRWPWPVRIHMLGGFSVEINGEPVQFVRKAQHRPLELLRALAALGGRDVNERRLADALWPESEGDAALQSLATTLHRARKLLAHEDAILRREGRVSFNAGCCWIDAIAFSDLIDAAGECPRNSDRRRMLTRAVNLYGGSFLADTDTAWSIPARERSEAMFTRALADLAEDSETRGRLEEAAAWYQYGVERTPVSESLYRGLIRCCLRQGETAAAASAYRRCEKMLSTMLDVSPSHKTRELAATFLRTG